MKRQFIIFAVFALMVIFALSGCGQTAQQTPETPPVSEGVETQQETPAVELPATTPVLDPSPSIETEQPAQAEVKEVTISFDFTRMSTHASNQFAVWIEDANGKLIKTLFVSNFASARRGYRAREDAIPSWVSAANPDAMTDAEIDAISSATPGTGAQAFSWDMTDTEGNRVSDGVYTVLVEGTLYWSSTVLYAAELDTADAAGGELSVVETRSEPQNTDNETMIENVRVSVAIFQ